MLKRSWLGNNRKDEAWFCFRHLQKLEREGRYRFKIPDSYDWFHPFDAILCCPEGGKFCAIEYKMTDTASFANGFRHLLKPHQEKNLLAVVESGGTSFVGIYNRKLNIYKFIQIFEERNFDAFLSFNADASGDWA